MNQDSFAAVDSYLSGLYVDSDSALAEGLAASDAAGLPQIQVAPNQGKMLMILAKIVGAKSILEIGTLGGYSTTWLARALPADGRLVTLEFEQLHADVARKNLDRAGVGHLVEIVVGPAMDSLPGVSGPFDLIFIDADKDNYPGYFEHAMRLSHPGSVIIGDNVVRGGKVVDPGETDSDIEGIRAFNEMVGKDPRVTATAIQTVGSKDWDGFAIAYVN